MQSVRESYKTDPAGFMKAVEDIINQPNISNILDTFIDPQTGQLSESVDVGALLHAAVANNPNNLIPGPAKRGDDPGVKQDRKLLQFQTSKYQKNARKLHERSELVDRTEGNRTRKRQKDPTGALYAQAHQPQPKQAKWRRNPDNTWVTQVKPIH